MVPAAIPEVKDAIRRVRRTEARQLADEALRLTTTADVRGYLHDYANRACS